MLNSLRSKWARLSALTARASFTGLLHGQYPFQTVKAAQRWLTDVAPERIAEEPGYITELKFASLEDASPIPVFRTLTDEGVALRNSVPEADFDKSLALRIYRTMLRLHITDSLFYEAQRQVHHISRHRVKTQSSVRDD